MKAMKIGDFVVIGIILILSLVIYFFTTKKPENSNNKIVEITVDGKIYKEFPLSKKSESINIDTKYGHNIVKVEDGLVYMYESDCKDQICVHMGKISDVGDNIICLPNRLLVKIVSDSDDDTDEMDLILKWAKIKK